jgi:hypothetical protein
VNAIDVLSVETLDDELLDLLLGFEKAARPEVKDAMVPAALRILSGRADHPKGRALAGRLLGLDDVDAIMALPATGSPAPPAADGLIALPPPLHRYSEEVRLNALALLACGKSDENRRVILAGMNETARIGLDASLRAYGKLEHARDAVLFPIVEQCAASAQAEYRTFSAWLLRERYGDRPARILIRLLVDDDYRVHRYAHAVLAKRGLEPEMIEQLLLHAAPSKWSRSWHLDHIVELLADPARFVGREREADVQGRIVDALRTVAERHPNARLRLVAARALRAHGAPVSDTGPTMTS